MAERKQNSRMVAPRKLPVSRKSSSKSAEVSKLAFSNANLNSDVPMLIPSQRIHQSVMETENTEVATKVKEKNKVIFSACIYENESYEHEEFEDYSDEFEDDSNAKVEMHNVTKLFNAAAYRKNNESISKPISVSSPTRLISNFSKINKESLGDAEIQYTMNEELKIIPNVSKSEALTGKIIESESKISSKNDALQLKEQLQEKNVKRNSSEEFPTMSKGEHQMNFYGHNADKFLWETNEKSINIDFKEIPAQKRVDIFRMKEISKNLAKNTKKLKFSLSEPIVLFELLPISESELYKLRLSLQISDKNDYGIRQISTQTNDDARTVDTQTDSIQKIHKGLQFEFGCDETDFQYLLAELKLKQMKKKNREKVQDSERSKKGEDILKRNYFIDGSENQSISSSQSVEAKMTSVGQSNKSDDNIFLYAGQRTKLGRFLDKFAPIIKVVCEKNNEKIRKKEHHEETKLVEKQLLNSSWVPLSFKDMDIFKKFGVNIECYNVKCTGFSSDFSSKLAVAFQPPKIGKNDSFSIFSGQSLVCLFEEFNSQRREYNGQCLLALEGLVSCICWGNSSMPFILLVGTMEGTISIWDVREIMNSSKNIHLPFNSPHEQIEKGHETGIIAITCVSMSQSSSNFGQFVSLDDFGTVIIWQVKENNFTRGHEFGSRIILECHQKVLNCQSVSKKHRFSDDFSCLHTDINVNQKMNSKSAEKIHVSTSSSVTDSRSVSNSTTFSTLTCIEFSKCDTSTYLLGRENGTIFQLSVFGLPISPRVFFPCKNKGDFSTQGSTTCIRYSPFFPDFFLVGMSCGSIYLFNKKYSVPISVFEGFLDIDQLIVDVLWSNLRPSMFIVLGLSGCLYVFDLAVEDNQPMYIEKGPSLKLTEVMHPLQTSFSLHNNCDLSVLGILTCDNSVWSIDLSYLFCKRRIDCNRNDEIARVHKILQLLMK